MRSARLLAATLTIGQLAAVESARAERAPTGEIIAHELPGFVTIDRASEESFGEVTAGTSFFEGEDPDFNVRVDVYGQYVMPSGAGGYLSLPVSGYFVEDENETAFGNLEFGALYAARLSPHTAVVLRGGLMLPTADDDLSGAFVNWATAYARHTDWISCQPDTTWLRLAISPMHRSGNFFLRADAGVDYVLDEPAGADYSALTRLNFGAGFTNGAVAVMGELVWLHFTEGAWHGSESSYSAAASVRGGMGGGVQGYAAIVLPVEGDEVWTTTEFALLVGMRIPIEH